MPDVPATATPVPEHADAYALLSKPTKDMSDADVLLVIADLRRRRFTSLATGKPDKPVKEAKAKRIAPDAEEKKRNTAAILSQLVLPGAGDIKL